MSAAQQACRLLNTLEYKRRQKEPAPKGFGEILGAAQNIVKDSQVQQAASWRPTEIQLQDEDYIHKQLVAPPEAPSPRRNKGVRLGKGLRLASRVVRQPTRKVRWGDGSSGGLGSPTGAVSRNRSSTSGGGCSHDCSTALKHTPAAGKGAAAGAGGGENRWEVEGVSIDRNGPSTSSSSSSSAAAAADVSTSGRDASLAPGVRLPQIHQGKPLVGSAASNSSSNHSSGEPGVRTSLEKQQQLQGQSHAPQQQQQQQQHSSQQQLTASLRPQAGSPPPADTSSNRGAGAGSHTRFGGEGGPSGRSSPVTLPQAAGGGGAAQKASAASAAGLNGDLMALYLSQPESSSGSLHASSDAGSQQDNRGVSAATDKADQQLQRLRQTTTARKEADISEDSEGEDPWTQELGYKPLAIPDSMFAKWTEASHHKPAAAATAGGAGAGSSSSSRGPSARRASVATYNPGSSLQPAGGARGAAAGGASAGWSSSGHARRASIGTVYPTDDGSLAGKLSSSGAAAAAAAGAGLPRRQSLSSDAPPLVPSGAAGPQRAHSGHAPSLPSLGNKGAAGSLAASLRSGANATSSSTAASSTTKASSAARAPSAALGHRL